MDRVAAPMADGRCRDVNRSLYWCSMMQTRHRAFTAVPSRGAPVLPVARRQRESLATRESVEVATNEPHSTSQTAVARVKEYAFMKANRAMVPLATICQALALPASA